MIIIAIIFAQFRTLSTIVLAIPITHIPLVVTLIFTALNLIGPYCVAWPVATITGTWAAVWTVGVAGTLRFTLFFGFLTFADAKAITMAALRTDVGLINTRLNASPYVSKVIFNALVEAWARTWILAEVSTVHIFPVELGIATIISGAWTTVLTSGVAWALSMATCLFRIPHDIALVLACTRLTLTVAILTWLIAFLRTCLFLLTPYFKTLVQISGFVGTILGAIV